MPGPVFRKHGMTVIADGGDADGSSMAHNEYRARVGPYGFEWPEDFDHEGHEAFWRGYRAVLARRLRKWERLLSSSSADQPPPALRRHSAKLKRYVRKGIPREHRKQVWMSLSGAAALQREQRGLYQSLLQLRRQPELVEAIQIAVQGGTLLAAQTFHGPSRTTCTSMGEASSRRHCSMCWWPTRSSTRASATARA